MQSEESSPNPASIRATLTFACGIALAIGLVGGCGGGGGGGEESFSITSTGCEIQHERWSTSDTTCLATIVWNRSIVALEVWNLDRSVYSAGMSAGNPIRSSSFRARNSGFHIIKATLDDGTRAETTFWVTCASHLGMSPEGCGITNAPPRKDAREVVLVYNGSVFSALDGTTQVQVTTPAESDSIPFDLRFPGVLHTCSAGTKAIQPGYPIFRCGRTVYYFDINSMSLRLWGGQIPPGTQWYNRYAPLVTEEEQFALDLNQHKETLVVSGIAYSASGVNVTGTFWFSARGAGDAFGSQEECFGGFCGPVPALFRRVSDGTVSSVGSSNLFPGWIVSSAGPF